MNAINKTADLAARAGEQLFQFAIDRGDMKVILDTLPPMAAGKRAVLEYEIQLLRIISVGWAVAFFLVEDELKIPIGELFWEHVRAFAATLSTSASLTVGSDINYFDILKQRLDFYVGTLDGAGQVSQPTMVIGPAFADACGDIDDPCATLAGGKMFSHIIHAVREYLRETVGQQDRNGEHP